MIDFAGIPPFLRIALRVAKAFSDSPNRFISRNIIFWHLGDPMEQFGIHEKLSWGCKVGQN